MRNSRTSNRWMHLPGPLALSALLALLALPILLPARAGALPCRSAADCPAGQLCQAVPCTAIACDPDDGECPEPDCPEAGECTDAWYGECAQDGDCPAGWVCEVIGAAGCAGVACPDGGECPEAPPCEEQEVRGCVPPPPPPCRDDADCAAGLVCVSFTYTLCQGGGTATSARCPAGEQCEEQSAAGPGAEGETSCAEVTEGYCVPPYVAPCQVDADCGAGFRCVQEEICSCSKAEPSSGSASPPPPPEGSGSDGSGGGGSGGGESGGSGAGGSGAGVPAREHPDEGEPDCSCVAGEARYCELVETDCRADADCPAGMSCAELPAATKGCAADPESGAEACAEEAEPAEPARQCLPADWSVWGGGAEARESSGSAGSPEPPGSGSSNPYHDSLAGAMGAEDVQGAARADEVSGPGGGPGGGSDGDGRKADSSGCALAAAPAGAGGGSGWTVVVMLIALTLRWRRR